MNNGENHNCSSRSTSVTLMSFDHSYWKQLRLLRLKHFLLQPRKQKQLTKVKSFPTTPAHGNPIKLAFRVNKPGNDNESKSANEQGRKAIGAICNRNNTETNGNNNENEFNESGCDDDGVTILNSSSDNREVSYDWRQKKELNKLTSLSDSNLKNMKRVNLKEITNNDDTTVIRCYRVPMSEDASSSRPPSIIIVRSKSSNAPITLQTISSFPLTTKNCIDKRQCSCSLKEEEEGGKYFPCIHRHQYDKNTIKVYNEDEEEDSRKRRRNAEKRMKNVITMNSQREIDNEKIRKEKENLKRRETEFQHQQQHGEGMKECCKRFEPDEVSADDEEKKRKRDYNNKKMDNRTGAAESVATRSSTPASTSSLIVRRKQQRSSHGDSESSLQSLVNNRKPTHLLYNKYGSSRDTDFLHDDDDEDEGEQDFEMDYYDYDANNAANIPGSLFGLEPAFVLWNSDMYCEDTEEEGNVEDNLTVSRTEELFPRTISSTTNTYYDNDDSDMATISDNGDRLVMSTTTDSYISNSSSIAPPPLPTTTNITSKMYGGGRNHEPMEIELREQNMYHNSTNNSNGENKKPNNKLLFQVRDTSLAETELFDDEL